jgi:hypothetical protein
MMTANTQPKLTLKAKKRRVLIEFEIVCLIWKLTYNTTLAQRPNCRYSSSVGERMAGPVELSDHALNHMKSRCGGCRSGRGFS